MKLIDRSIQQNLHLYFFYLFLLSIPFQTRKVFLTEYSFYSGAFTEWTTVFLYASDVFLILALVFWLISVLRLRNYQFKNIISSPFIIPTKAEIYYCSKIKLFLQAFISNLTIPGLKWTPEKLLFRYSIDFLPHFGSVCRQANSSTESACFTGANYDKKTRNSLEFSSEKLKQSENKNALSYYKNHILSKEWLFLYIFLVWLVLNLMINRGYLGISAFHTVKLIELSLLMIFVYFNLQNSKVLVNSLFILAFSGFLQSLIAIYQFIAQHSVFLFPILTKITGESTIGPQIPGVAKIVADGDKIIRAYGTFPHPNVLCGFLVFTILVTIYLYLEYKKDSLSSSGLNSTSRNSDICANVKRNLQILPLNTLFTSILKFSSLYNTNNNKSQVYTTPLLWIFFLLIQFTGLFFTFSRSAWLGLLLSLLIISAFYFYNYKIVSRETIHKMQQKLVNRFLFALFKIIKKITNIKNKTIRQNLVYNFCKSKNVINREDSSNNITLFNKLSTTFQHNFYTQLIIKYKELFVAIMIMIIIACVNFSLILSRFDVNLHNEKFVSDNSAINDRIFYNNVSRETISNNLIFGSGVGTFVFQIDNYLQTKDKSQKLQPWQYQPAHNIYFLIASEIGIIGLILFLLLIVNALYKLPLKNFNIHTNRRRHIDVSPSIGVSYTCNKINSSVEATNKIVSRETIDTDLNVYLLVILIAFLFIGFFDHYFWTLQQGKLIFWLVLGLIMLAPDYKK